MPNIQLLGGPRDGEIIAATPDADGSVSVTWTCDPPDSAERITLCNYVPWPEMDIKNVENIKKKELHGHYRCAELKWQSLKVEGAD